MDRSLAWFELRISPELASEIDLIRCNQDNLPNFQHAMARMMLRGLAATWEQRREACIVGSEKERLSKQADNDDSGHQAKIQECDDALSRLAKLSSVDGEELIRSQMEASMARPKKLRAS